MMTVACNREKDVTSSAFASYIQEKQPCNSHVGSRLFAFKNTNDEKFNFFHCVHHGKCTAARGREENKREADHNMMSKTTM